MTSTGMQPCGAGTSRTANSAHHKRKRPAGAIQSTAAIASRHRTGRVLDLLVAFRSSAHAAELPLIERGSAVVTTFSVRRRRRRLWRASIRATRR